MIHINGLLGPRTNMQLFERYDMQRHVLLGFELSKNAEPQTTANSKLQTAALIST